MGPTEARTGRSNGTTSAPHADGAPTVRTSVPKPTLRRTARASNTSSAPSAFSLDGLKK